MNLLFIHQNFPGQYLHLASYLRDMGGDTGGHTIIGVGQEDNIKRRGTIKGITTVGYPKPKGAGKEVHHYLFSTEAAVRQGQAAARALLSLRQKGYVPDAICVHPGWGEGLFVRDVFPSVPILMFCEFFFTASEADMGFDPEFPSSLDWEFSIRIRNAPQLIALPTADILVSPTAWQASRYPVCFQRNMRVIHDGVNIEFMTPDASERVVVQPSVVPGESRIYLPAAPPNEIPQAAKPGKALRTSDKQDSSATGQGLAGGEKTAFGAGGQGDEQKSGTRANSAAGREDDTPRPVDAGPPLLFGKGDKVITYVARNLEPYRGFHILLRALPTIQRRHPDAHMLIVGADGVSYSGALPKGETYKEKFLTEMRDTLDLSRVHFLGKVPYTVLRALFRVSAAHIYLTYPFVLSWSILEAMACEALLIASRTAPVQEVLTDGKDSLLVDFFDQAGLVEAVDKALTTPAAFTGIRKAARETVVRRYALKQCLEQQTRLLFEAVAAKKSGGA